MGVLKMNKGVNHSTAAPPGIYCAFKICEHMGTAGSMDEQLETCRRREKNQALLYPRPVLLLGKTLALCAPESEGSPGQHVLFPQPMPSAPSFHLIADMRLWSLAIAFLNTVPSVNFVGSG